MASQVADAHDEFRHMTHSCSHALSWRPVAGYRIKSFFWANGPSFVDLPPNRVGLSHWVL